MLTRFPSRRLAAALPGVLGLWLSLAATAQPVPGQPQPAPESDQPAPDTPPAEEGSMDLAGLERFVSGVDPEFQRQGNAWQFRFGGREIVLVADPDADRMRLLTPVARAADLDEHLQYRLLQANFDTALDARYAVARELVWSAYIHPLSPLDRAQLSDALLQVWTAAATFGTTFSSGALQYGGGDSQEAIRKRRQELLEQLQPRT